MGNPDTVGNALDGNLLPFLVAVGGGGGGGGSVDPELRARSFTAEPPFLLSAPGGGGGGGGLGGILGVLLYAID